MDYNNPFSMAQNQNPVPTNPFWSGMMGERNQANAYPFMRNNYEDQNLDLQKKRLVQEEFESPLARRTREMGLTHDLESKKADVANLPFKTEAEKQKYLGEIRSLPVLTEEKIAKAGEVMRNIRSQPHKELLADLGTLYDTLHKMPEDKVDAEGNLTGGSARGQVYLNAIARHRMLNPGIDIPEQLRSYHPGILGDLAAIRYNQLNSPEQVGKEKLAHIAGGYKLDDERMGNASAERRAEIAAAASRYGADKSAERAAAAETPAKAVARLQREIRKDPTNQEAQDELKGYLNDNFSKWLKDHPEMGNLQIGMIGNDPQKKLEARLRMEQLRKGYFEEHGVKLPDNTIRIKVESSGQEYDPENYEYKIENNKIFKKAKIKK